MTKSFIARIVTVGVAIACARLAGQEDADPSTPIADREIRFSVYTTEYDEFGKAAKAYATESLAARPTSSPLPPIWRSGAVATARKLG